MESVAHGWDLFSALDAERLPEAEQLAEAQAAAEAERLAVEQAELDAEKGGEL